MNLCLYLLKAASVFDLAARFSPCGMIACFPTKYVQTPLQGAPRGGHPRDREFLQDCIRGLSASNLGSAEHRKIFCLARCVLYFCFSFGLCGARRLRLSTHDQFYRLRRAACAICKTSLCAGGQGVGATFRAKRGGGTALDCLFAERKKICAPTNSAVLFVLFCGTNL